MPSGYGYSVVDKLLDDLRMYGNAFAITKEKPMNTLDFSKPLRISSTNCSVEVVKEGVTLVRWCSAAQDMYTYAAIDETGLVMRTNDWANPGFSVENVPEPQKDHLHLYRYPSGAWRVNTCLGDQFFTRERAENESAHWARHAGKENTMVVKVPS